MAWQAEHEFEAATLLYGTTQQELDMPSTYIAQMWSAHAPYNTITNPAMLIIYQIIIDENNYPWAIQSESNNMDLNLQH